MTYHKINKAKLVTRRRNCCPVQVIAEGISNGAASALRMLPEQTGASAETDITDFFLALFTALLPQLGDFAYTAIDVFLDVAQRYVQLTIIILQ